MTASDNEHQPPQPPRRAGADQKKKKRRYPGPLGITIAVVIVLIMAFVYATQVVLAVSSPPKSCFRALSLW